MSTPDTKEAMKFYGGWSKKFHHWRWRNRYLLLCGISDGLIDIENPKNITCKRCLAILKNKTEDFQR
jgi:hypothetical protein